MLRSNLAPFLLPSVGYKLSALLDFWFCALGNWASVFPIVEISIVECAFCDVAKVMFLRKNSYKSSSIPARTLGISHLTHLSNFKLVFACEQLVRYGVDCFLQILIAFGVGGKV